MLLLHISERPYSKQDYPLSMSLYLNIIQDTKKDPVPADPVPHASRELPEPAQDVNESGSSEDDDGQNSNQDEDSEPKWSDDEKSDQISEENNSDVRAKYSKPSFNLKVKLLTIELFEN